VLLDDYRGKLRLKAIINLLRREEVLCLKKCLKILL